MTSSSFKLKIIVPEKTYFDGNADSISVVTSGGMLTILAHHADLIANIEISHMTLKSNGHITEYALSGGVMNIYQKDNTVLLIVNAIESQEEIDLERAMKAKENAQKRLQEQDLPLREQMKAEIKLKRALNRISLKNSK